MAMTGFKSFRRKGGDISAQALETEVTIGGVDFSPGDYMVLDQGELTGAKKDEFEATFEPVRKNYNKPLTPEQKAAKKAAKAQG